MRNDAIGHRRRVVSTAACSSIVSRTVQTSEDRPRRRRVLMRPDALSVDQELQRAADDCDIDWKFCTFADASSQVDV